MKDIKVGDSVVVENLDQHGPRLFTVLKVTTINNSSVMRFMRITGRQHGSGQWCTCYAHTPKPGDAERVARTRVSVRIARRQLAALAVNENNLEAIEAFIKEHTK